MSIVIKSLRTTGTAHMYVTQKHIQSILINIRSELTAHMPISGRHQLCHL